MPGIAIAHRESTTPDGVLVQEAAAGSGVSYGSLYDRYAEQVYNYCLRVTGSAEDAADATQEAFVNVLRRLHEGDQPVLDFSSYLFAAARNESYALMRRRARVQPSETIPEELGRPADVETQPESAVLMRDTQEAVRAANAQLAPRHREVLALRELGDHSYDEIGRIMGISENGAAQLIWRARSKMREAMTAGAVASVVAATSECERAQVLLSAIQDGQPVDDFDRIWLDEHLDECGKCQSAKGMLLEVGAFYCAWIPVAAVTAMKADTLTAAGSIIGADWSGVAGGGAGAGGAGGGAAGGGAAGAGGGGIGGGAVGGAVAGVATLAAIGVALSAVLKDDPQLERNVASEPDRPAVTAPEPRAKKAAREAASPIASETGAFGAANFLRGLRPPTAGEPAADDAPRSDSPPSNNPGTPGLGRPDGPPPGGGPLDQTPSPQPRSDPQTDRGPPPDSGPDSGPPPENPPPEGCTWPGGGGGPTGCPPGHGAVPPGHGGTPPGQHETPPGQSGTPPGQGGTPPGQILP